MKIYKFMLAALLIGVLFGCGEVPPPGKTAIILSADGKSRIVERGVFRAYGRDKLYWVDQKLQSYTEKMEILCADDINMTVDIKCILSFEVTKDSIEFIKKKVPAVPVDPNDSGEGMQLSLDQFYKMTVSDVVRGSARNTISPYITDDIRPSRQKLEAEIHALVLKRMKELKYPLKVSAVLIANIDYPQSVKDMRERIKQAQLRDQESAANAEAQLAEAKRQVAIEQELAKVRMIKAQAQADENTILSSSLTPPFLKWRGYEVMETVAGKLAAGESNTVFMMPYEAMSRDVLNSAMIKQSVDQLKTRSVAQAPGD